MTDANTGVAESAGKVLTVRRAVIRDVPTMADIINRHAAGGEMLARSHHQLYQFVRDFSVVVDEETVLACGALHVVWEDIGEIRSLAVADEWQGQGLGRRLVESLLGEARELGLPKVFALTYKQGFFQHMGFHLVPHESLPHKIWADCLNCPKFPNCDEIAMMIELD
jgi:amino-acid N-acetyltransferase